MCSLKVPISHSFPSFCCLSLLFDIKRQHEIWLVTENPDVARLKLLFPGWSGLFSEICGPRLYLCMKANMPLFAELTSPGKAIHCLESRAIVLFSRHCMTQM